MDTPTVAPKTWTPVTKKITKRNWEQKKPVRINNAVNIADFVQVLEAAFQRDMTVQQACDQAGLAVRTFYDHLKKDPEFAERIRKAREFPKAAAKNRMMTIINDGSDRDAGPMVRWFLEKREPENYAPSKMPGEGGGNTNNTQNNFYFLNNEQISNLAKQPDIAQSDPTELLEALEAEPVMDSGTETESPTPVYQEASQVNNS